MARQWFCLALAVLTIPCGPFLRAAHGQQRNWLIQQQHQQQAARMVQQQQMHQRQMMMQRQAQYQVMMQRQAQYQVMMQRQAQQQAMQARMQFHHYAPPMSIRPYQNPARMVNNQPQPRPPVRLVGIGGQPRLLVGNRGVALISPGSTYLSKPSVAPRAKPLTQQFAMPTFGGRQLGIDRYSQSKANSFGQLVSYSASPYGQNGPSRAKYDLDRQSDTIKKLSLGLVAAGYTGLVISMDRYDKKQRALEGENARMAVGQMYKVGDQVRSVKMWQQSILVGGGWRNYWVGTIFSDNLDGSYLIRIDSDFRPDASNRRNPQPFVRGDFLK